MFDVTALGELLIDFTPEGKNSQDMELFARNPGGAPANVLAMNARLGGRTAFIGKVGRDEFGHFLRKTLRNNNVDTTGLVMDPNVGTTLAFVHLDDHGDRSFSFYRRPGADMMLRSEELDKTIISTGCIFHFGSVSLTHDPCRTTVHTAVRLAKRKGNLISYDPNYRPFLWQSVEEAKREMLRVLGYADIVKVSEEEMRLLTGETNLEKGALSLVEQGPFIVFITLGASGTFYLCADGCGTLPAYEVDTVDTTGAGDAFLGAVHYRLRGKNVSQIQVMTNAELADVVDFANAAASLTTGKKGAIPAMPSLDEVEHCRKTVPTLFQ